MDRRQTRGAVDTLIDRTFRPLNCEADRGCWYVKHEDKCKGEYCVKETQHGVSHFELLI